MNINTIKTVIKNGYKSKTVIFGYALMLLTGLQGMSPDIAEVFGSHGKLITFFIGAAVVALRAATTTPLADK